MPDDFADSLERALARGGDQGATLVAVLDRGDLGIHLPPPSVLPLLLAFAITMFFGGFMIHWAITVVAGIGIALLMYAMAFEPGHSGH